MKIYCYTTVFFTDKDDEMFAAFLSHKMNNMTQCVNKYIPLL